MMLQMRNKKNELKAKDILDMDLDMSVEEKEGKYRVKLNKSFYSENEYDSQIEAENELKKLANARNQLEEELRIYS